MGLLGWLTNLGMGGGTATVCTIQEEITQRISGDPTGDYLNTLTNYNPVAYDPFPEPEGGFVWNTNCWAADLNWTGVGAWAEGQYWFAATLISRRHILTAHHCGIDPTDIVYFIASDSSVYAAEVAAKQQVGTTDFDVAYLTEDVPAGITYYSVVPENYNDYLSYDPTDLGDDPPDNPDGLYGKPLIVCDKERKATIGRVFLINQGISTNADDYKYTDREAYWEGVEPGDSSAPNFLLASGELLLAGTNASGNVYQVTATFIDFPGRIAAVNAVMASLDTGSTGYQLTIGDLPDEAVRVPMLIFQSGIFATVS